MNCLFCTLCSLFPINTKSMSFYREVLVSTPSLFLFYPPNLPPRQVVRRSLLFFLLSLPSCENSFYCRVSPNCVGRDECGDPNRNDLSTFLSEIKQQVVLEGVWNTACVSDVWTTFVVFYYGPGHVHNMYTGASQVRPPKACGGSCGQCRTVHEEKPLGKTSVTLLPIRH